MIGAVAVAVVASLVGDDDGGDPAASDESTTTTEPLSDTAQELLDRLEVGRQEPLHVLLEAPASTDGSAFTVEIWRDGDRVRQDLVLSAPGVRTELSAFHLPDGNVVCQRAAEEEWRCERSVSVATENGAPAGIIEGAAANLSGAEVTATDEVIDGTPARCYEIQAEASTSTMCVTEDGVPVRLSVQGQELTATTVERQVDAAAFDLPAEPTEPSPG